MKDYIYIGSSPVEEPCAQVGSPDYFERSRAECKAFAAQLLRQFPDQPDSTYFIVKAQAHDFGTYREVVVVYDDADEESLNYALKVEGNTPANWDEQAKQELAAAGFMVEA